MKRNRVKLLTIAGFVLAVLALASVEDRSAVRVQAFDTAADYKAKCAMCHGQKAEKAFDPAKPIESHVQIILKGKADSKPPMPGYEAKGMTAEQAKALADHMVALRAQ